MDAPVSFKNVSYRKALCLASCIAVPCAVAAFSPVELYCDVEAFSPSLVGLVLENSPVLEKERSCLCAVPSPVALVESLAPHSVLGPEAVAIIKAEIEDVKLSLRDSLDCLRTELEEMNLRSELEEMKASLVSTVMKSVFAVVPACVGDGIEAVDTGTEENFVGDGMEPVNSVTENCVGDGIGSVVTVAADLKVLVANTSSDYCAEPTDWIGEKPVDEVYLGLQSLRMYCSPLAKESIWNTNAKEYLPLHGVELSEERNSVNAAQYGRNSEASNSVHAAKYGCNTEASNSVQSHMKVYSFKRGHLMSNLHEVVYSGQQHLKLYRFVRTEMSDSVYDDAEDSRTRNADAYMANWHSSFDSSARNAYTCLAIRQNLEDSLPGSFNSNACFFDYLPFTSDWGDLLL